MEGIDTNLFVSSNNTVDCVKNSNKKRQRKKKDNDGAANTRRFAMGYGISYNRQHNECEVQKYQNINFIFTHNSHYNLSVSVCAMRS